MTPLRPPRSVLIVDDNRDAADGPALPIRSRGYEARTASSPRDAGRVIDCGFSPRAVLMDIGLPGADGYAVARDLCAGLGYRPLVIAVTGHQGRDGRSDREGFDLHFLKPVDPALVLKVLDIYAGGRVRAPAAGTTTP